jgi:hypothetical protein
MHKQQKRHTSVKNLDKSRANSLAHRARTLDPSRDASTMTTVAVSDRLRCSAVCYYLSSEVRHRRRPVVPERNREVMMDHSFESGIFLDISNAESLLRLFVASRIVLLTRFGGILHLCFIALVLIPISMKKRRRPSENRRPLRCRCGVQFFVNMSDKQSIKHVLQCHALTKISMF